MSRPDKTRAAAIATTNREGAEQRHLAVQQGTKQQLARFHFLSIICEATGSLARLGLPFLSGSGLQGLQQLRRRSGPLTLRVAICTRA